MKKYYVYVIELDQVVGAKRKFRTKNPRYIRGNNCVYVGQTTRKPSLRFEQHKEGYKSNKYAKHYGLKLRPDLYEKYNPIHKKGCRRYWRNVRRGTSKSRIWSMV